MKLKNAAIGILIAIGLAVVIVCPSVEAPADPTPAQVAAVGPLLDAMAAMCGQAFDARRHRLIVVDGQVTGCEAKP